MKRVIVSLMFIIFMTATASAFEWDNKLDYENEDLKVKLTNSFGFGKTIGTAELKSHNSVNEIKEVGRGDQIVMWYDFKFNELYLNGLGEVKFIDLKTGKKIDKEYSFVYWEEEEYFVEDYSCGNKNNESCGQITKVRGQWLPYNSKDIPLEEIRIGLKTYVTKGDYIDGIWEIAGRKVSKHASWTELGSESVGGIVTASDVSSMSIDLASVVETGFIKAVGLQRGNGAVNSFFLVNISQDNVGLAEKNFTVETSGIHYANFTQEDYLRAINQGDFSIVITQQTGDIDLQSNTASFNGSLFNFTSQVVPATSGTTFTYAEVEVSGLEIALNSPINNFNSTISEVSFSGDVTDNFLVENVSLLIDGFVNQTNTSQFNGTYLFSDFFADGSYNWSMRGFDNESNVINAPTRFFEVETSIPTINVTSPLGIFDYSGIGFTENLNVTFTDPNIDTCSYDYNGTNVTIAGCISGTQNTTTFILEENNFNMTLYVNDTFGNVNSTFIGWGYKVFELARSFVTPVIETDSQTFTINVSSNVTISSVDLDYDGSPRSTTFLNNGSTVTFDIPNSPGNKTLFWRFNRGAEVINSTPLNQTVNNLLFDFCNATLTVPYINFTFTNETIGEEPVTAIFDSAWNVWLGSGSNHESFTLTNSSENNNYLICTSASNQILITNVSLTYSNSISQQRSFVSSPILTNSSTTQNLFLLPTALGILNQFIARDIANNPISLVSGVISRTLGGSTVTVSSGFTDSSGLVIFFLNPDITYTGLFSKLGFSDNTFSFVPTSDIRFVTMGTGVTVEGSNITIGANYVITPSNSSLTNNTDVTFGFNVTGNSEVNFISMNLTNSSGVSLAFVSNPAGGFISSLLNTGNNTIISGLFVVRTPEENLTFTKVWIIGNEFIGDYSIQRQGTLFNDYGFSDFIRLLMIISILFGAVIYMSSNELADNSESKIAVVVLLIWMFSLIHWLDNPAIIADTGIAQYGKQYGIAILSTVAGLFFFMRRIFL